MDRLRERLDGLERRERAAKSQLRCWKAIGSAALVLGLGSLALRPAHPQRVEDPLEQRVAALESAVTTLRAQLAAEVTARQEADRGLAEAMAHLGAITQGLHDKLGRVSVENIDGCYSIVIEGANLHLRNGLGNTETNNCLGNLIVGYNEPRPALVANHRTGSHNVVVGNYQNFTQFGGLVVGQANTISGRHAVVSGGYGNTASGDWATVSGGHQNHASGLWSSVSGGRSNVASGSTGSVSGGWSNTASGPFASVSGGQDRSANGNYNWRAGNLWQHH